MVPALEVLCFFGVTRSIGATMGPILYSTGNPKIQTKLSAIQLFSIVVIIYPLTISLKLVGISLAVLFSNLLALILVIRETKKILTYSYKEFFTILAVPSFTFLAVMLLLLLPIVLLPHQVNIFFLLVILFLATIIYSLIMYLWDRKKYRILENIYNLSDIFSC